MTTVLISLLVGLAAGLMLLVVSYLLSTVILALAGLVIDILNGRKKTK